jgi:hypothetical protein
MPEGIEAPRIPLMPLFGALPIAVAAIVIARIWSRRRDVPLADLVVSLLA